jgi:Hint domain
MSRSRLLFASTIVIRTNATELRTCRETVLDKLVKKISYIALVFSDGRGQRDRRVRKFEREGAAHPPQHRKMASIMAPAALASAVLARTMPAQAAVCAAAPRCNCFLKGTRILTAEGECKVEDLAIGDVLPAMFGGTRPIQWIGRYPLKKTDRSKPWVRDAWPVRIARSALATGVPQANLYVTGWHALFIDGLLVPAGCLINGTTITRYEAGAYDEWSSSTSSSKVTT